MIGRVFAWMVAWPLAWVWLYTLGSTFHAAAGATLLPTTSRNFEDINTIGIGFSRRSLNFVPPGDVGEMPPLSTWNLDLNTRVWRAFWDDTRPAVDLRLQIPQGGVGRTSLKDPRDFVPLRYSVSDGDFGAEIALNKSLLDESVTLKLGHRFVVSATAAAEAQIGKNPSARMELATGPVGSWFGAISATRRPHTWGLTYAQNLAARVTQSVDAGFEVAGVILNQPVTLSATTRWEPETAAVLYHYQATRFQRFGIHLAWENWRPFEAPFLNIESPLAQNRITVAPTLQNTLSPGLDWMWQMGDHRTDFAYQFRPTPLTYDSLTRGLNLFDTDTHRFALIYRWQATPSAGFFFSLTRDIWVPRRVEKSNPNPPGVSGVPGYTIEGGAWFIGTAVRVVL